VKFTERGEVVLSARLDRDPAGQPVVAVSVRDTGIGVPADKLASIFEGFSQAEHSTARRFGGTGLGLAISQRLVELMGGTISVASEFGVGSTFRFTFPFEPSQARSIPGPAADKLKGLSALVVDDNDSARQVLAGMVRSFGWSATEAPGGAEALAILTEAFQRQEFFDIVLLDWRMPKIDGWETAQRIKDLFGSGRSPLIVMVTAYDRAALEQRRAEAPALLDNFLVKPITASMLFDAVAEARVGSAAAAPKRLGERPTGKLTGVRLLLVEDNPTNQQVARELLQSAGAQVTVAEGGRRALDLLGARPDSFDAVLMDVQMPDLDGYAATRELRTRLGLTLLPVIAMTANAMPADRLAALESGMNDHVAKPFDLANLVDVIGRHIGGNGQTAPRGETPEIQAPLECGALDVVTALSRFCDDTGIYRRALQSFAVEAPRLLDRIKSAADADPRALGLLLHSLKGAAAQIGADPLAAMLSRAEQVPAESFQPWLPEISPLVQQAVEAALTVATRWPEDAAGLGIDGLALGGELQRLRALLEDSNMAAVDGFETLRLHYAGGMPREFEELGTAIHKLDFAAALLICDSMQVALRG
jgi:CheY-like chemotaxis protein